MVGGRSACPGSGFGAGGQAGEPAAGHSFAHGAGHGADAASDRMGSIRGATAPPEGGGQTCGTTAHPITTVPAHADAAATAVECGLGCGPWAGGQGAHMTVAQGVVDQDEQLAGG